jgi:hypothetical protein
VIVRPHRVRLHACAGLVRRHLVDYCDRMTRDEALDPSASWIATERDGDWVVVRIGVEPTKATGTATKPPPVAPQDDPHSASERAAWFAGGAG